MKKFDFVIGNPPYQVEQNSEDIEGSHKNYAPPVYHLFLEAARKISKKVVLITPARFLFNAGSTPKEWNQKMLNDKHFKIIKYIPDSSEVFPTLPSPIKGGVVITYSDDSTDFGIIGAFTQYQEINTVLHKVIQSNGYKSLIDLVYPRTSYRMTDLMHNEHPNAIKKLSKGHAYDMASNIFERLPEIFFDEMPKDNNDYVRILGRIHNQRIYKYIKRDYINNVDNLEFYKVLIPQANGNGTFGEVISNPIIEKPHEGNTETFISIGKFNTKNEAEHCSKYLKTKFARAILSVLKVTQNGNKPVWKYVPLQDFTNDSDIDWTQSIINIDKQLYNKYKLSDDEINFIESHVKEMQ